MSMGDLQGFVPSFVVASACGLVSGFLAVFSLFRGCVAVFTATWPGFVDFLLVKFLITDRETVLLVTNSEFQSLICILALYHRPMSSTSAVASNCVCWTTTSTLRVESQSSIMQNATPRASRFHSDTESHI